MNGVLLIKSSRFESLWMIGQSAMDFKVEQMCLWETWLLIFLLTNQPTDQTVSYHHHHHFIFALDRLIQSKGESMITLMTTHFRVNRSVQDSNSRIRISY